MKTTTAFDLIAKVKGHVRVICGASRSSKTYSILQHLVLLAVNNKGNKKMRITIASRTLKHCRENAMEDFLEILINNGLYSSKFHNKTDSTYKLGNITYKFIGCEDPLTLRGIKSTILFVNEANLVPHDSFQQLLMRTDICSYIDYNPSHKSWVTDYIQEDKLNFLRLDYSHNEFISKGTLATFKMKLKLAEEGDEDAQYFCDVYIWGKEGKLPNRIFNKHTELDELPEGVNFRGTGFDWGFSNDPNACVKLYQMEKDIYLVESLYQKGLLNSEIYNHFIEDEDISNNVIVADSSENKSIAELSGFGLPIKACTKGPGSIMAGINLMKEYNIHLIGKNLVNEFETYTWQSDASGNRIPIPTDKNNHLIDAARYIVTDKLSKAQIRYSAPRIIAW